MKIELPRVYLTKVERNDDTETDDEVWEKGFLAQNRALGFTMQGGYWIGLKMDCGEPWLIVDHVPVWRRFTAVEREPNSTAESFDPRFMTHRAFPNRLIDIPNWAAEYLNAIIATNDGRLPNEWIERAE